MSIDMNPGKLFETSGSYWTACALHAGVKKIKRLDFKGPTESSIICGTV